MNMRTLGNVQRPVAKHPVAYKYLDAALALHRPCRAGAYAGPAFVAHRLGQQRIGRENGVGQHRVHTLAWTKLGREKQLAHPQLAQTGRAAYHAQADDAIGRRGTGMHRAAGMRMKWVVDRHGSVPLILQQKHDPAQQVRGEHLVDVLVGIAVVRPPVQALFGHLECAAHHATSHGDHTLRVAEYRAGMHLGRRVGKAVDRSDAHQVGPGLARSLLDAVTQVLHHR